MDSNNIRGLVGQYSAPPNVARNIRILLVDNDTDSLQYIASQFEQQSYIVTATESAEVALGLVRDMKTYYDTVIADRHMPHMDIYEFVHEVHRQNINIPIMLIDDEKSVDSVWEAMLHHRVCYVFSKPLSRLDIANFWQHIPRVIHKLPSDIDKRNTIQNNSKKSRMTWTPKLHQKFLYAVQRLGEDATRPNMIIRLMNEPDLKYHHVASHLQKHRNGLQAPNNQESAGDIGIGMYGEGTANQSFDGMHGEDDEWDVEKIWEQISQV